MAEALPVKPYQNLPDVRYREIRRAVAYELLDWPTSASTSAARTKIVARALAALRPAERYGIMRMAEIKRDADYHRRRSGRG